MCRHVLMPARVGMTLSVSVKNLTGSMPNRPRKSLTTPRLPSSIHTHSSATITLGISQGNSRIPRIITDLVSLSISTAMATARMVWEAMLMTVYWNVILSDSHTWRSSSSRS